MCIYWSWSDIIALHYIYTYVCMWNMYVSVYVCVHAYAGRWFTCMSCTVKWLACVSWPIKWFSMFVMLSQVIQCVMGSQVIQRVCQARAVSDKHYLTLGLLVTTSSTLCIRLHTITSLSWHHHPTDQYRPGTYLYHTRHKYSTGRMHIFTQYSNNACNTRTV